MNKSKQIYLAFSFGVVFVVVMLAIAIAIPYPTAFQLVTFRVTLALAAGGVAAMLPGFLNVNVSNYIRSGGALAGFVMIYFFNPAQLSFQGTPTNWPGVFIESTNEDKNLVEYFWKQAGVRFRFPKNGWTISTKAAESGLGDMTLQHKSGKHAQIQLHVSILDEKYRENWTLFQKNTIDIWKGTISQFGPFDSKEIYVDGRASFQMSGIIKGQESGFKNVSLIYAPLGDNRLFEMHLTRNAGHALEPDLLQVFDLISSTVAFER